MKLKMILGAMALLLGVTASALAGEGAIDTGDTAWLIVSTALVMMMTPAGLALFYGGMSRYKNLLNTLAMTFVSYCLASVVWMMWGYTLAFGSSKAGLVGGLNHFFLAGIGVNSVTGTIPKRRIPTCPTSNSLPVDIMRTRIPFFIEPSTTRI